MSEWNGWLGVILGRMEFTWEKLSELMGVIGVEFSWDKTSMF